MYDEIRTKYTIIIKLVKNNNGSAILVVVQVVNQNHGKASTEFYD